MVRSSGGGAVVGSSDGEQWWWSNGWEAMVVEQWLEAVVKSSDGLIDQQKMLLRYCYYLPFALGRAPCIDQSMEKVHVEAYYSASKREGV